MRGYLPLLSLVLSLAGVGAAQAALDDKKIAAAQKAADAFVRMAADSHRTGKPPRQADATVDRLLAAVFDTGAATTGVEFADLPKIFQWLKIADRVGLVYMLAGTGTKDLLRAARDPKTAARIARNTAEFDAEYGRFTDFQLTLAGYTLDAIQAKIRSAPAKERDHPKFRAGFAQVTIGIAQTIGGVLDGFLTEGIGDGWRRDRLVLLQQLAPKMAQTLPRQMRETMRDLALTVSEKLEDPDSKTGLQDFGNSLMREKKDD